MKFYVDMPVRKLPIVAIGAGGIVHDAHFPAYRLAGFAVAGVYDINVARARTLAEEFHVPEVYETLGELIDKAPDDAVYDIALPASEIIPVLDKIPKGSAVLIQKPMGDSLEKAKAILEIARNRSLIAGINFQLRYAPFIMEARNLIHRGLIGKLCDIEVNVNVHTPWNLWDFVVKSPRIEILYHSIHYIDLIRSFFGEPEGVMAKTTRHPGMKDLYPVRSNIIMDYGEWVRGNILTNHCHDFGPKHQQSYLKFEGTKGAIRVNMGLLMDYPRGTADVFEYFSRQEGERSEWQTVSIEGTWFPHAFIGSMAQVMRAASGEIPAPDNSVEDCIRTMACVEAAYRSSENGSTRVE